MTKTCIDCGINLSSRWQWQKGIRPAQTRAHAAHDRCTMCHGRHRRAVARARRTPPALWPADQPKPLGPCLGCGREVYSRSRPIPPGGRKVHQTQRCGSPACRRPTTAPSPFRTREETLEEYALIRDDVVDVRAAAARMGMTFAALDRALHRARVDGDPRAAYPLTQIINRRSA